jgi:hypothetical protein
MWSHHTLVSRLLPTQFVPLHFTGIPPFSESNVGHRALGWRRVAPSCRQCYSTEHYSMRRSLVSVFVLYLRNWFTHVVQICQWRSPGRIKVVGRVYFLFIPFSYGTWNKISTRLKLNYSYQSTRIDTRRKQQLTAQCIKSDISFATIKFCMRRPARCATERKNMLRICNIQKGKCDVAYLFPFSFHFCAYSVVFQFRRLKPNSGL